MKRNLLVALLVSGFIFAGSISAQSAFDNDKAKDIMHMNLANLKQAQAAVKGQDYYGAADALYAIAHANEAFLKMDPPKGSKEDWDKLFQQLIDTSLKGVGAAGEKDDAKLDENLKMLVEIMKRGHGEFRG